MERRAVELRGDHDTVLGNWLSRSRSWNLKLASDPATYDRGGNTEPGDTFSAAATYAIINRQTGAGRSAATPSPDRSATPAGQRRHADRPVHRGTSAIRDTAGNPLTTTSWSSTTGR